MLESNQNVKSNLLTDGCTFATFMAGICYYICLFWNLQEAKSILDDEILLQQPLTPKPDAVLNLYFIHVSFTPLVSSSRICHVLAVPSVLSAFLLFSLSSPGSPA